MNKIKTLFFDVETTGTNPEKCSIVQLSGLIDIDGEVVEEFNFDVRPDPDAEISPDALDVIGKTKEQLKAYPPAAQAYLDFMKVLDRHVDKYDRADKFFPAGYNVRLDLDFLQWFFKKRGNKYGTGTYQNWRAIDVMQIVHYLNFVGKLNLENYKLGTLCNHFKIEIKAHDSLSDIRATRALLLRLKEVLRT